jgi:hypothetical protein
VCYSLAGCVYYTLRGRGPVCLRAKVEALRGLRRTCAKRQHDVPHERVRRVAALAERHWWLVKWLWRERRQDRGLA